MVSVLFSLFLVLLVMRYIGCSCGASQLGGKQFDCLIVWVKLRVPRQHCPPSHHDFDSRLIQSRSLHQDVHSYHIIYQSLKLRHESPLTHSLITSLTTSCYCPSGWGTPPACGSTASYPTCSPSGVAPALKAHSRFSSGSAASGFDSFYAGAPAFPCSPRRNSSCHPFAALRSV